MASKYYYYKSSKNEPKHEITRKEFIKLLGESNHCVDQVKVVDGIYMDVANYKKAERELINAQRREYGTMWSCGPYTLYLEHAFDVQRRMRDSRYPDPQ